MEEYLRDRWYVQEFDSMDECLEVAIDRGQIYSPDRYRESVRSGLPDLLPEALELSESVVDQLFQERKIGVKFDPVFDVSGAVVDVGRYLSGEPECMIDFPPTLGGPRRVITLVGCSSYNWEVSYEALEAQGRAVTALTLALETAGHSVEIWSDDGTAYGGNPNVMDVPLDYSNGVHLAKVKLKGVDDTIDPARILYAMATSEFGREIADSYFTKCRRMVPNAGQGARAVSPNRAFYPPGSILIPMPTSLTTTKEEHARQFVLKLLKEIGEVSE